MLTVERMQQLDSEIKETEQRALKARSNLYNAMFNLPSDELLSEQEIERIRKLETIYSDYVAVYNRLMFVKMNG